MQNTERQRKTRGIIEIVIIVLLCAFTVVLDFIAIPYLKDPLRNRLLSKIIQQSCGATAGILILLRLGIKLFGKPQNLLYMIPCLIIAIDNFQFSSYFNGYMQLVRTSPLDMILFIGYCLSVGLFEELIFRGIVLSVVAGLFSKDKKGFLLTFLISSVIFGLAHILNGFSLGTLLQVGYTILTGGLFAFCLIKTKNIFCCAFVHALYNFCGMLFENFDPAGGLMGLGSGVVFDTGTIITMIVVSVLVGAFVLWKVLTYKEEERICLYKKLGVKETKESKNNTQENNLR